MKQAWIVALAASCTSSAPAPVISSSAATRPVSLTGTYRTPHSVWVVCQSEQQDDDGCEDEAEDVLRLDEQPGGRLHAVIDVTRANHHTCSFEGTLEPAAPTTPGERRWTFDQPGGEADDGPCRLALVHRDQAIEITAEGCRYYCGMRATLDATFAYPATSLDPKQRAEGDPER
jgi:hypothetical protein